MINIAIAMNPFPTASPRGKLTPHAKPVPLAVHASLGKEWGRFTDLSSRIPLPIDDETVEWCKSLLSDPLANECQSEAARQLSRLHRAGER